MIVLIVCLVAALLFYALYRRPHVRFGLRILGTTLFLEAHDRTAESEPEVDVGKQLLESTKFPSGRTDSPVARPDQKGETNLH